MALTGLILSTVLTAMPAANTPLACTFPDSQKKAAPITVQVKHNPSLFDIGSNFQVHLNMPRVGDFDAAARPEEESEHWDVIIRGVRKDRRVAVGLKSDGTALLRMVGADKETRLGRCEGYETYLKR
jgi:hypothetical protein